MRRSRRVPARGLLEASAAIIIAQLFGGLPSRSVFNLVDDRHRVA
ncbi:hypothetical protein [Nocardia sp. NPDC058497]